METDQDLELINKRLVRKLDLRIIPILAIVYTLCYLDRVNIGHARLYGIETSLNLSSNDYAWSLSIFFVGYVILEIPSNLVMTKVAPNRWLSSLMMIWGLVSIGMAFSFNFTGLMITRFLLGVFESGFFPGIVFYISLWYSRQEQGFRLASVSACTQLAGLLGGLIAYSMHELVGVGGLEGWQWLFLVEGIPTILMGGLIWLILPSNPNNVSWLTKPERQLLITKLSNNFMKPGNKEFKFKFKFNDMLRVFKDVKIYLYGTIFFGLSIPMYAMAFLMPTIIEEMGFTNLQAMLLTSPPSGLAFIITLLMAAHSDRKVNRSLYLIISLLVTTLGFTLFLILTNVYLKYFSLFFIMTGIVSSFPSALAWLNNNYLGSTTRTATSTSFVLTLANISGIISSHLYQPNELQSHYFQSNLINILVLILVLIVTLVLKWLLRRENLKLDKLELDESTDQSFRYIL